MTHKTHFLTALAVLSFVALAVPPAQAQVPAREERRELRQEFRQERREITQEQVADRVERRFARHEERLQNWIDRVATHLNTKAAAGKDVRDAEVALETARTSLAKASALGDQGVAALRAIEPDVWQNQKPAALSAREAIILAQRAYGDVVRDMRAVVVELKKIK